MATKRYPSKKQPVKSPDNFPSRKPGVTGSPGDKVTDQHNPYHYRANVDRDPEDAMRSRPGRSDYGKTAQVQDEFPDEGTFPVVPQVIRPG